MTFARLADAGAREAYGGKAAQLAACVRAGLPVPRGVALDWQLVARISEGAPDALELAAAAFDDVGGPVAVRSSAVDEDGGTTSFAGQHATVLNVVTRDAMADAIARVHASARDDGARAYRAKMGAASAARVGVVVQRLVDAACAGVLFTRDPMTGADEIVIESSWGLGEAVVSGLVVPDRYRLDRTGRVIERTAGDKDVVVVARAGGGTEHALAERSHAVAMTADDAQLRTLFELALRCEAAFGSEGHDLEWAFARGDGEVALLQRRPITSLAKGGAR